MAKKSKKTEILICDRAGTPLEHKDGTQTKLLRFLYGSAPGRLALKGLTCPVVSRLTGAAMDHPLSTIAIPFSVKKMQIPLWEYEKVVYRSYNEFFTRMILPQYRPVNPDPDILISPCDAKLTVLPIEEDTRFVIKNAEYRLADMIGCERLAEQFIGGDCLIFRLTPDDYHRYCFPDDCAVGKTKEIPGKLHTVNPIAADYHVKVYHHNARTVTMLHTEHFGRLLQIEVGAMLIGRIVNHPHRQMQQVKRGAEKGYFAFGGSTVVVITEPWRVKIDADLRRNSIHGYETIVHFGERIGTTE